MSTYRAYNTKLNVYASPEIPNVLEPVALAGVSVSSGSNIVTVTSTTGVYPGMGLSIPNLPEGSFVQSVKSATEIVAYAPLLSTTTGEWTVTAAAANATDTASSMTGHAHGFNPIPIPRAFTDADPWRNTFGSSFKSTDLKLPVPIAGPAFTYIDPAGLQGGTIVKPGTTVTVGETSTGVGNKLVASTDLQVVVSDEFAEKPYRAKTKWVHEFLLVATGGAITRIPVTGNIAIVRISASAA